MFKKNKNTTEFFEMFDIDKDLFFSRDIDTRRKEKLRSSILESELEDFKSLSSELDDFLMNLHNTFICILIRYKIDGRNSFKNDLHSSYQRVLSEIEELIDCLESQEDFYEKRIKEIEKELNNLKEI